MDGLEPDYPLRTERLLLRPFTADDFGPMHDMWSREDVVRWLYTGPRDADDTRALLGRKMTARPDDIAFAAVLASTGAFVADLNIVCTSREHRQGEIGFVVHPDHQRRGYASEATRELLRLCFAELGLHRVAGTAEARNVASRGVLAKVGMRLEAHLVENEWVKGEWQSEVTYALLDREWRRAHAKP